MVKRCGSRMNERKANAKTQRAKRFREEERVPRPRDQNILGLEDPSYRLG